MGYIAFKKSKMRDAIDRNDIAALTSLLDRGVPVDMDDDFGHTFLGYAISHGNRDAVRLLIDRGADTDRRNYHSGTMLHLAAALGSVEICEMLLEKNPGLITVADRLGNTPLHAAARRGHSEVVVLLIAKGARTEQKNFENRTALFYAQYERQEDVIRILKAYQKPLTLPVSAAAEPVAAKPAEPVMTDGWKRLSRHKIARVETEYAINRRLTEIFNFETRERTQIRENLATRFETSETRRFDEIPEQAPVEEALQELQKRGGQGSISPLQKPKPVKP